ncbi:MAG TPA: sigma-70 family RNA polymerase sigma factor [Bryobacteraceae bacterium]
MAAILTSRATAEERTSIPSFASAVETHKAMVYSIAWHFLRDRPLAEELAQDVFLELHRHWKSMKSAEHILFWLRRTAVNRAIDRVRNRKIRAETSLEEISEPTVLEQIHDTYLSAYLERMVASLPEKQRAAIVLRYQEDMEPEEIAGLLKMNVSTVKTQVARGLELLRSKTAHRLRGEGKLG